MVVLFGLCRSIVGRSPFLGNVKGRVSSIKLAPGLLASFPNVSAVDLENMDLSTQVSMIPSLLPPKLTDLSLMNTRLTAVPTGLGIFKNLQALYVLTVTLRMLRCIDSGTYPVTCASVVLLQALIAQRTHERGHDRGLGQPLRAVRKTLSLWMWQCEAALYRALCMCLTAGS